MPLSKKALDMLEYNGYSFKNEKGRFVFRHSSSDGFGLAIALLFIASFIIFLITIAPSYGIGALIISILIFAPMVRKTSSSPKLTIDPAKNELMLDQGEVKRPFSDIQSIYTHSKFVDEYSSAFKSTSKEYRVTIGLEINQQQIPLFKLIADHAKPSKEMNEVHAFLENVIGKNKSN